MTDQGWRKSSFSVDYACVAVRPASAAGGLACRRGCVELGNTRRPDGDVLHLTGAEFAQLLDAVKAGALDDLI